MADEFVDETPTTIQFVQSGKTLVVDDNYDEISGRLNQVSSEPSPIIKATVAGEERTLLLRESVVISSGRQEVTFD